MNDDTIENKVSSASHADTIADVHFLLENQKRISRDTRRNIDLYTDIGALAGGLFGVGLCEVTQGYAPAVQEYGEAMRYLAPGIIGTYFTLAGAMVGFGAGLAQGRVKSVRNFLKLSKTLEQAGLSKEAESSLIEQVTESNKECSMRAEYMRKRQLMGGGTGFVLGSFAGIVLAQQAGWNGAEQAVQQKFTAAGSLSYGILGAVAGVYCMRIQQLYARIRKK